MNSSLYDYRKHSKSKDKSILILSVFLSTYFIYTDFNIRQLVGYFILCAFLILDINGRIILTRTKKTFLFLVFSMLLYFVFPNAKHDKDTISYILAMLIFTMYLMLAKFDEKSVNNALIVFQIASLSIMFILLFFRIFPGLYWTYVYPLLSEVTQEEADIYMKRGYSIPLAGGYTYGNYIFSVAFWISLGQLIIKKKLNKQKKIMAEIVAVASVLGMVLMGRRSELISLVIVFFILKLIYRNKNITYKKTIKFLLLFPVLIVILFLAFQVFNDMGFLSRYISTYNKIVNNIGEGLNSILGGKSDITSGRIQLWKIAVELLKKYPLLGIGVFRFGDHVPAAFSEIHGRGLVTNVHNDYLQHLCEMGIFGALMVSIPTVYLIFEALKQAKRIRKDKKIYSSSVYILNIGALGIQLFYAILGIIDPCFYQMTYWSFYTVGIIFLEFALQIEKEDTEGKINKC